MGLVLDREALSAYLDEIFPQFANDFDITGLAAMEISTRMATHAQHARPGGTISGPTIFAMADLTFYALVLSMIGRTSLAVTTNCTIDFMRKPAAEAALTADARLLKLGRVLVVGDVLIQSEGSDKIVARASLTYSIPPAGSAAAQAG
ncbi:MAG: PaaI family thioesterase [Pseudomonadota bacterium]